MGYGMPAGPGLEHALRRTRLPMVRSTGRAERVPDLQGVPWARIAEFVGQRDLTVTANTYTHLLIDEAEFDYEGMLR
jgi:hypothetical protein